MAADPKLTRTHREPAGSGDANAASRPYGTSNRRMFATMLFGAVFRRRSRAVMAVIAAAIGAATLFCLTAVCLVVPQRMTEEMRAYGANLIVTPSSSTAAGDVGASGTAKGGSSEPQQSQQSPGLSDTQITALTKRITAVAPAPHAAYRYETMRINSTPYTIAGIDPAAVRTLNHHWDVEGHWPSAGNIMVGQDLASTLGLQAGSFVTMTFKTGEAPKTGAGTWSKPQENKIEFRVGGIVSTGGNEDDIVYAVAADVAKLTGTARGADVVEYSSSASDAQLASLVTSLNKDSSLGAQAKQTTKITSSNARIVTMLRTLFWIVSLVVLVLTLVGVGTTISSIVSQRRNEIGLRKALGASTLGIGAEFYAESALYGLFGGAIGTAVGYVFARVLSVSIFNYALAFSWVLGVGSVVFTMVVAVLASIPPVRRATTIDPAVVLREE